MNMAKTHKLPVKGREVVFKLIKEGDSNKEILEKLVKQFGVSISSPYISQMRKTQTIHDMTFWNRDVESKVKEKLKIDANILKLAREITEQANKWFVINKDNIQNYSAKEIAMVMGSFHKFFKSYQEMAGGTERSETVHTNIMSMVNKAGDDE